MFISKNGEHKHAASNDEQRKPFVFCCVSYEETVPVMMKFSLLNQFTLDQRYSPFRNLLKKLLKKYFKVYAIKVLYMAFEYSRENNFRLKNVWNTKKTPHYDSSHSQSQEDFWHYQPKGDYEKVRS